MLQLHGITVWVDAGAAREGKWQRTETRKGGKGQGGREGLPTGLGAAHGLGPAPMLYKRCCVYAAGTIRLHQREPGWLAGGYLAMAAAAAAA